MDDGMPAPPERLERVQSILDIPSNQDGSNQTAEEGEDLRI